MADRVKGITIEIDGETKGLSQALSSVNKEIKTTQSELRDVNKLLKLDPGNATLLKQKMEGLKKEIGETKDKLAQLKSVQDQMDEGLKNGTVTQAQYDAWQREIIETENELKNLEQELKNVPNAVDVAVESAGGKMEEFGNKISAVGDSIAGLGDKMTTYVTGPIVAGATAAVAAWSELDAASDNLIKKTGATGATLEDFEEIVNSLATTMPVGFDEASDAVGQINTRFDVTGKELEDLSRYFLEFAHLNGTDVVASIDAVSGTLSTWGMDVSEAADVLDLFNAVGQSTGVDVNKLSTVIGDNALAFKEMGYDIADAATLVGSLEKKGIDSSVAIRGLQTAFKDATADGESMGDAILRWQNRMSIGYISETQKMQETIDLFGNKAGMQIYNAMKEGNLTFSNTKANLEDFSGSVQKTFDATLSPIDEFKTTANDLKITLADIGEEVVPVLVDVLNDLKPILDDVKEAWEGLSPEEQRELVENLGKIALIGPSLSVLGHTIGGIGIGISTIGKAVKWIGGLGIGAKIASLGTSLASIGTLLTSTVTVATAIPGTIVGALAGGGIADLLDRYIIAPLAEWAGSDFAQWYRDFKWFGDEGFFAIVFGDLESTWGGIKLWLEDSFNNLITIVTDVFAILKGLGIIIGYEIGKLFEGIKELVSTAWLAIKAATETVWNGITSFLSNTWAAIQDTSRAVWEGITTALESAWTAITSVISDSAFWITDFLATTWDTITAGAQAAWDTVTGIFTSIKDTVIGAFEDIWNFVSGVWADIQSLFTEGFDIKLPHLSVTGEFSIDPPSVPSFDIDWYKDGGILTRPTLFGMSGGHLLGGGEAGAEAVLPLNALQGMIDDGLSRVGGDVHLTVQLGNEKLGSLVVSAQEMMNLRRGR